MKFSFRRRVAEAVQAFFGVHPDVVRLITGGFRLTNPSSADFPSENLPLATRVIASGMWNYCFFQFYQNFAGPYWVERQYNPRDDSFIPRAGSLMSLNLTHRNWCGFRGPSAISFGMVDPAGALSPVIGFYSIEVALEHDGTVFLPTRSEVKVSQHLAGDLPIPVTVYSKGGVHAAWSVTGDPADHGAVLSLLDVNCQSEGWSLLLSVRPFNPEGAALLDHIEYTSGVDGNHLHINRQAEIRLHDLPDEVHVSNLETGDAYFARTGNRSASCPYGVATAVMKYALEPGRRRIVLCARTYEQVAPAQVDAIARKKEHAPTRRLEVRDFGKPRRKIREKYVLRGQLPLSERYVLRENVEGDHAQSALLWERRLASASQFQSARETWNRAARIHSGFVMSLQTEHRVTPGVFTYRQFWFRDAAYMLSALSGWNLMAEARRVLETYPARQERDGFFKSHEGEWDSNGQAIWALTDYFRKSGDRELLTQAFPSIVSGAQWILHRRRKGYKKKLLPPGFSAEHLGPADHYYWDNLWSIAGLREAAFAARVLGAQNEKIARSFEVERARYAGDFLSISRPERQRYGLLTAAPNRGIDPGIIGSIVHLYPLALDILPEDEVRNTVHTLHARYFQDDLFFHPIIHSGFNIYLSLQVAQSFLSLGYARTARRIFRRVLQKRTELWTYPEAIHPRTGGGVMGDGFHGWASAEILLLLRSFVVAEEPGELLIFRGLRERELLGAALLFGPFPLRGGRITIEGKMDARGGTLRLDFDGVDLSGVGKVQIFLPYEDLSEGRIRVRGAHVRLRGGRLILQNVEREVSIEVLKAR